MAIDFDVKFLGVVTSFNEEKGFGMISCAEAQLMWHGNDIYAYKDVLNHCKCKVGDTIRFGVHVSPKGLPQASLPCYKVEDGVPVDMAIGADFVNAEDMASTDPTFLDRLKVDIEEKSSQQNRKRGRSKGPPGGRSAKSAAIGAWPPVQGKGGKGGVPDAWGAGPDPSWEGVPAAWAPQAPGGGGGGGWGGGPGRVDGGVPEAWACGAGPGAGAGAGDWWGPPAQDGVTLFVGGVPPGIPRRELLHIFRQYAGFQELRQVDKDDRTLVFVSFAMPEQAQFVTEALTGYVFDEEAPPEFQQMLSLSIAKTRPGGKR